MSKTPLPPIRCAVCGREFIPATRKIRTCSPACSNKLSIRNSARNTKLKEPVVRVCAVCGREFRTVSKARRTCSQACASALASKGRGARPKTPEEQWAEDRSCPPPPPLKTDAHGLRVMFHGMTAASRCPLVDSGELSLEEVLDFHPVGCPSVRAVCDMPRERRKLYTEEWLASEYVAALRYLEAADRSPRCCKRSRQN